MPRRDAVAQPEPAHSNPPPAMTRLPLVALTSFVTLSGCGYTQSTSANFPRHLEKLEFTADRPIARELRYTYQRRIDLGGEEGDPIGSADPVTRQAFARGEPVPLLTATPPNAEDWGDHYSAMADAAQDRGDTEGALMYRELAVSRAETQAAVNQISTAGNMLETYASVMSGLGAVGQAWFDSDAAKVAEWTGRTSGAIGAAAPEGSILHLDFLHVVHGERFQGTSQQEFFVTAVLDDGAGTIWRADRVVELYTYKPDDAPAFVPPDAVALRIPIGTPQPEELLSDLGGDPYVRLNAIMGRAAVASLYAQMGLD